MADERISGSDTGLSSQKGTGQLQKPTPWWLSNHLQVSHVFSLISLSPTSFQDDLSTLAVLVAQDPVIALRQRCATVYALVVGLARLVAGPILLPALLTHREHRIRQSATIATYAALDPSPTSHCVLARHLELHRQ